jgi:hypothetical protein
MKDFYELDDWKQSELLMELIERLGAENARSLQVLSEKEGRAPLVIWSEMCVARGIELCSIPERVLTAGRV